MTFGSALRDAQQGRRIRRRAWSRDSHDNNYHADLVVMKDGRIMSQNTNQWYEPGLKAEDVWADDWEVAKGK